MHAIPTTEQCPTWCTEPHAHPFEYADADSRDWWIRTHSHYLDTVETRPSGSRAAGAVTIGLIADEARLQGGAQIADDPAVDLYLERSIHGPGAAVKLTADQAREVAALLLKAADQLGGVR